MEAVAYVRGVEAGRLWASTNAEPEELERLRVENERHARPAIHDWAVTSLINPLELPGYSSFTRQEGPLYAG